MNLHPPCQGCGRPRTAKSEPKFPGSVLHGQGDYCELCSRRRRRIEAGANPNLAPEAPDWTDAACAEVGGNAWFPEQGDHADRAVAVCLECPIREACLTYALDTAQQWGIWGALSTKERQKIRRRQQRKRVAA